MAGIANPNLKTFFQGTPRSGEVTGADWAGGANRAASNAPGVGINTGDYDPKVTDWSRDVRDPQNSNVIGGGTPAPVTVDQDPDLNDQVSFVQATGDVAPGAAIIAGVTNQTGKTIPNGSWAWGLKAQA